MFHEMLGKEEHIPAILNLHRVFLTLVIELEDDIRSIIGSGESRNNALLDKVMVKIKAGLGDDTQLDDIRIAQDFLKSYNFESLNEA